MGAGGEFEVVQFRVGLWLFHEVDDAARVIHFEDAEVGCGFSRYGFDGDGEVRAFCAVRGDKVPVVHPIEVIAREDETLVHRVVHEVAQLLAHGIGCALIPVGAILGLFGRENLDKAR